MHDQNFESHNNTSMLQCYRKKSYITDIIQVSDLIFKHLNVQECQVNYIIRMKIISPLTFIMSIDFNLYLQQTCGADEEEFLS